MALRRNFPEPAAETGPMTGTIADTASESGSRDGMEAPQTAALRPWSNEDASVLLDILQSHGLSVSLTQRLVRCAAAPMHERPSVERLALALGAEFNFLDIEEALARPIVLFGLPGAGTSSIVAKIAARFDDSALLVIAAGAAAVEKSAVLADWLEALDLALALAKDPAALRLAVAKASGRKIVIDLGLARLGADSAKTVREWIAAAGGEGILVLSAETPPDHALAAAQAAAASGVARLLVTHLDSARYLGAVLGAAEATKLALVGASITPHFGFGLRALTPENLARRLMSAATHAERWRIAPL